jgi:4'-phosphopantetheinyl transferase
VTATLASQQPFAIFYPHQRCAVQLWKTSLDDDRDDLRSCLARLSDDERSRADRYHNRVHRSRFIRARSMLRCVLADYLHADPAEIRFAYSQYGKPSLADSCGNHPLHFNLSHSGGTMLLAICDRPVGVDVEEVREFDDLMAVAKRTFSTEMLEELARSPRNDRTRRFFQLWTLQEARLKAHGLGLPALDDRNAQLTAALASAAWSVSIDEPANFIAAVAVRD